MPHIINSLYNVSDFRDTTVEEIVEAVRNDYGAAVHKIRQTLDPAERKRLKINLPLFTLGNFVQRIDSDGFISTKYLMFDVDGLGESMVDAAKKKVRDFSLFTFKSPSGGGIKFIVEMAEPLDKLTYDGNYKFYLDYFTDMTGLNLDRAYHSKHSFFSWDKDCKLNPNPTKFTVMNVVQQREYDDVDLDTIDTGEINDIVEHIGATGTLNYHEWTLVALSLQALGSKGMELFLSLARKDTTPEHHHRDWTNKFQTVGKPKVVTLSYIYGLAFKRGYKRKDHLTKEGKGHKLPFILLPDGMYLETSERGRGKIYNRRVFGFREIKVLYTVLDNRNGNKILLRVDGYDIPVPQKALAVIPDFRSTLLKLMPGLTYLSVAEGKPYDLLFNYLDRTQSRMRVTYAPGIGNIAPGIWNLGNAVIMDNGILPWEQIIHTADDKGYMLDDCSAEVYIEGNRIFYEKLLQMFEFYNEWAAIAMGWAFSNIYYQQILNKCGGFPVLFMHGKTKSGKSQLAHLILSMFGIKNPENADDFKLSMDKATGKAMSRIKNKAFGIPTMFDEYGSGSNARKREEHFLTLKSMFDASGLTMAKFSNDDQITRLAVRSGSMFTACNKETQEEAVNRCVYVCMDGVSSHKDSKEFERLYQGFGRRDMAAFLPMCILRTEYKQWINAYDEAYEQIRHVPVGSRVHSNYSTVMAGYKMVQYVVRKHVKLPDIPLEWWLGRLDTTHEFMTDADPVVIFLKHLEIMAIEMREKGAKGWVQFEYAGDDDDVVVVYMQTAIIEMQREYRNLETLLPSAEELRKRIREHPCYMGSKTINVGGKNCSGYRLRLLEEKSILDKSLEPIPQDEVPF